jgi:hypothetical protein
METAAISFFLSEEAVMDDRLTRLETRVSELSLSLEHLGRRLAALDGGAVAAPLPAVGTRPAAQEPEERVPEWVDFGGWMALVGRTLVALGGAYLLRALTDAVLLPQSLGVLIAFLYALGWLLLADRAGGRGRTTSAAFHGVTAALIGYPLLWEATARFGYLPPAGAALAVALFTALAFAVAWGPLGRAAVGVGGEFGVHGSGILGRVDRRQRAVPPGGGAHDVDQRGESDGGEGRAAPRAHHAAVEEGDEEEREAPQAEEQDGDGLVFDAQDLASRHVLQGLEHEVPLGPDVLERRRGGSGPPQEVGEGGPGYGSLRNPSSSRWKWCTPCSRAGE